MKNVRLIWIVLMAGFTFWLTGCEKQQEAVISVETEVMEEEMAESVESSLQVREESDVVKVLPIPAETEPGAVLKAEEVTLYTEMGEVQKTFYRMRGNYGYSIALDMDYLKFVLDESADRIFVNRSANAEASEALLLISENLEYALEELADEIVLSCSQECLVEEVVLGEEDYPATWITYTENTERGTHQVEYYLIGFENRVIEIQLICMESAMDTYYDIMQVTLSTLRLDSIAEG